MKKTTKTPEALCKIMDGFYTRVANGEYFVELVMSNPQVYSTVGIFTLFDFVEEEVLGGKDGK